LQYLKNLGLRSKNSEFVIHMSNITIDYSKCEGANCAECVDVCPMEVFIVDGDKIVIYNSEECSLCELCMDVCPNEAVIVKDE
jgi:NAD-dependent dihydropyrimidine dehydrogenase PreA subunit